MDQRSQSSDAAARACDDEPIHVPGSIQPHGVLFSIVGESLEIVRVSTSVESFLEVAPAAVLGQPLSNLLDDPSVAGIREALRGDPRDSNPLEVWSPLANRTFDAILHRAGDEVVIELEPRLRLSDFTFQQFHRRARNTTARLRQGRRVLDLSQLAAEEVRALTDFDRVMIYRFGEDGSGEVIAEARDPALEPFLGQRFPSSDIPAQARRLYVENWLRLIVDAEYEPSLVLHRDGQRAPVLDMTYSVLRSVSPVHRQYLKNMGVKGSMSISLVIDGKLWGLIACHHREGRFVPFEARALAEFLGEALSWQIGARERSEALELEAESQRALVHIVERMALHASSAEGLAAAGGAVVDLVNAEGAFLFHGGQVKILGVVPSEVDELERFRGWLVANVPPQGILVTNELSLTHPEAPPLVGSPGILALELSREEGDYLVWRRGEVIESVVWAGKPEKTASSEGALMPRASFEKWMETVRGKARPWTALQIATAGELRSAVVGGIRHRAVELARLNAELRASSFAKDEFLATVSHELRTPLNAMLGWLSLVEEGRLPESKRAQAMETIMRNARSQAQLVEDLLDVSRITSGKMRLDVRPVEVVQVVEAALESVQPMAEGRGVRLQPIMDPRAGPVMGDPQRLQQVVWNLLTNAVKFTPRGGRVQIRVQRVESSVEITVSDNGAGISRDFLPFVFDRFRQADGAMTRKHQGLGLGLSIVKHLVELHGGRASVMSDGEGTGATFTVLLPLALMHSDQTGVHPAVEEQKPSSMDSPPQLVGLRVLVVDDEPDATELLATVLARCQVDVVSASSAAEALSVLPRFRPHIIISDIGMPGMDGLEMIRRVRALPPNAGGRTLAVALTAFARSQDRSRAFLAGFDVYLPKPVDPSELLALVVSLAERLSRPSDETGEIRVTPDPSPERQRNTPSHPIAARALNGTLNGAKVLVIDDDDDNRWLLEEVFRAAGAVVESAGTSAGGVEAARSFRPDVLITDIGLPDGDGYGLLRAVRAGGAVAGGWVPAVALTGSSSSEDARRALLAGFQLHISKPVDIESLIDRVSKLIGWTGRSR